LYLLLLNIAVSRATITLKEGDFVKPKSFSPPLDLPDIPDTSNIDLKEMEENPKIAKYLERIRRLEKQQAEEMARKVADEKCRKRRDFLLQLVQALIVAAATLLIEHIPDIVRILRVLLQEQS